MRQFDVCESVAAMRYEAIDRWRERKDRGRGSGRRMEDGGGKDREREKRKGRGDKKRGRRVLEDTGGGDGEEYGKRLERPASYSSRKISKS
jgi:hypothetical protein